MCENTIAFENASINGSLSEVKEKIMVAKVIKAKPI